MCGSARLGLSQGRRRQRRVVFARCRAIASNLGPLPMSWVRHSRSSVPRQTTMVMAQSVIDTWLKGVVEHHLITLYALGSNKNY